MKAILLSLQVLQCFVSLSLSGVWVHHGDGVIPWINLLPGRKGHPRPSLAMKLSICFQDAKMRRVYFPVLTAAAPSFVYGSYSRNCHSTSQIKLISCVLRLLHMRNHCYPETMEWRATWKDPRFRALEIAAVGSRVCAPLAAKISFVPSLRKDNRINITIIQDSAYKHTCLPFSPLVLHWSTGSLRRRLQLPSIVKLQLKFEIAYSCHHKGSDLYSI
jgi:hypothetical protein